MNKQLKTAYVAIKDNEAVAFDTNLKEFVEKLKALEPECRNYDYYFRRFKSERVVLWVNDSGETYFLQRLLP